jgi:hypothetical protein
MLMKRILEGLSVICAVVAFWATAVQGQVSSIEDQLALAEAKWSTNKPKTYEFTLKIICFCPPAPPGSEPSVPPGPIVFRINNGTGSPVGSYRYRTPSPQLLEKYSTVEKQFAFIRAALREQPYRAEIEYDPVLGYPRRAYIDPSQITVDEEYGFTIEAFSVLSQ